MLADRKIISTLLLTLTLFVGANIAFAQARTATGGFRVITIKAVPNSTVWLDGVRFGKTNADGKLEIRTVSVGSHQLKVRSDGYKELVRTLTPTQKGEVVLTQLKTTDEAELAFQEAERQSFLDREKAAQAYRKAISFRPNYPDAFVALARVLTEIGDIEDAEKAIQSARKLRPVFAEASAVQGRIHRENGDEDKAIAAFKRAITEGKGFQPEANTGLGLLYKEKAEGIGGSGDFDAETAFYNESANYLKTALKQLSGAPDASIIYQLLGLIYERQKRYTEAIALYEEFLRIFPNSTDATAVQSFITQIKKEIASQ